MKLAPHSFLCALAFRNKNRRYAIAWHFYRKRRPQVFDRCICDRLAGFDRGLSVIVTSTFIGKIENPFSTASFRNAALQRVTAGMGVKSPPYFLAELLRR